MGDKFLLEQGWFAETKRTYKIEFEELPTEEEHFQFLFTATQPDGKAFLFKASVSPVLVQKLGIDVATQKNKLFKGVAGKGLGDLKIRLNAGHDVNFEGLPYIKTYTLRDKPLFEKVLA